jgi:acetyl-CoA acetyltransferase family protein
MEESAKTYAIARSDQDRLACESHIKAAAARDKGFFEDLITPHGAISQDALIRPETSVEKLAALRPAFDPDHGSLTAGNSSPLTDGAASLWVVNETGRRRFAPQTPAARIVDFEFGAVDVNAVGMLMAPGLAIPRLLRRSNLRSEDIALWEIHEAFAAQVIANLNLAAQVDAGLGAFPWDRLNPNGGSLALGHPFAATGARILSQAVKELAAFDHGARAVVSICADGGQATVMLLERA